MYVPKQDPRYPCPHLVDERIRFRAGDSPKAVTGGTGTCTGTSPLTYTEPRVQVELADPPSCTEPLFVPPRLQRRESVLTVKTVTQESPFLSEWNIGGLRV